MIIEVLEQQDLTAETAQAIARLRRQAFADLQQRGWDKQGVLSLLRGDGVQCMVIRDAGVLAAYLVMRCVADEAEILSLAVGADYRRNGFARALLICALQNLSAQGVQDFFLEVKADNQAAIGLYEKLGFKRGGKRRAYYTLQDGARADALLMRR